jgi:N-acetylneuraminic acid mutarotase
MNDVHVFNFGLRTWSNLAVDGPAPIPRDSHVAAIHSNSMYIFGGSTGTAMNDFYELNLGTVVGHIAMFVCLFLSYDTISIHPPETNQWQIMQYNGPSPGQRFCHVGGVYDSSLIIFGGYDGSSRLNDFKQFRFGEEEFELDIPESTLITDLRALVNQEVMSDITFMGNMA